MNLRQRVIKGGAFLLARQAVGIAISVVGVLLVTRIIGPRQYGLFAAGAGIVTFLYVLGTWGLDACLLRKTEDPEEKEFHQAFTLLLLSSAALAVGVIALRHVLAGFLKMPEESSLLFVLALGIPLNLLTVPAVVKLDRDLNFKQVAINELSSQFGYYLVAVPLAFRGAGAWAPVAGFLTQQTSLLTLSYCTAKYRPVLHWEHGLIRRMLGYGLSYSSSTWAWQLRTLVNPLIVGRFAGAEAVGYVAVCLRIAGVMSFAKGTAWRLAMPAFAKLGGDAARLRNGITEGMRFQAFAVGLPLASFTLLAPFLIPLGFGHHWASAVKVFPFIALSYLTNSMFNMHCSVLHVLGKNIRVAWFNAANVALLAGASAVLVPRLGFLGYGWAEAATLLSYPVIHFALAGTVGSPSYRAPAIWYLTCLGAIVLGAWGGAALYVGFAFLFAPLLFPKERSTLAGYTQVLFSRMSA